MVHGLGNAPEPLRSGLPLELGSGQAELLGLCTAVAARGFEGESGKWHKVRARWLHRCTRVRPVALRARFAFDAPYCTRLTGTLRLGGRRHRIVADRVPTCGNGLRETGEQCDGEDGAGADCCLVDCTVKPGCLLQCDRDRFLCGAEDICVGPCGSYGECLPRADFDCGVGPVCACDWITTYSDRCAAFDAGTAVRHQGACQPQPRRRPY